MFDRLAKPNLSSKLHRNCDKAAFLLVPQSFLGAGFNKHNMRQSLVSLTARPNTQLRRLYDNPAALALDELSSSLHTNLFDKVN